MENSKNGSWTSPFNIHVFSRLRGLCGEIIIIKFAKKNVKSLLNISSNIPNVDDFHKTKQKFNLQL